MMLYGIYNSNDQFGEWVAPQDGPMQLYSYSALEIFTTTHLGHALAQLSIWRHCDWLTRQGKLQVAVIGKDGKPSRFVEDEEA